MNFLKSFRRRKPEIPERTEFKSIPDFLVIGVQKGGTSWLWKQLRQHPKVWMPPFKELQFFNHEFLPSHRSWTVKHCESVVKKTINKKKLPGNPERRQAWQDYFSRISEGPMPSLDWYKKCFSFQVRPGVVRGDISPAYCSIPEEGVDFVKELLPDARIIMIVRNPHKRIISQVRMKISRAKLDTSEFNRRKWLKLIDNEHFYQRACYSQQIPFWDSRFGNQVLYLPFDLIRSDPGAFLLNITNHLGIKPFVPRKAEQAVHVTKKHAIPPYIEKTLEDRTAAELEYLRSRFPDDFLKLCQY